MSIYVFLFTIKVKEARGYELQREQSGGGNDMGRAGGMNGERENDAIIF